MAYLYSNPSFIEASVKFEKKRMFDQFSYDCHLLEKFSFKKWTYLFLYVLDRFQQHLYDPRLQGRLCLGLHQWWLKTIMSTQPISRIYTFSLQFLITQYEKQVYVHIKVLSTFHFVNKNCRSRSMFSELLLLKCYFETVRNLFTLALYHTLIL